MAGLWSQVSQAVITLLVLALASLLPLSSFIFSKQTTHLFLIVLPMPSFLLSLCADLDALCVAGMFSSSSISSWFSSAFSAFTKSLKVLGMLAYPFFQVLFFKMTQTFTTAAPKIISKTAFLYHFMVFWRKV